MGDAYARLLASPDSAGAVERLARELESGDATTVREAERNLRDFATYREVRDVKRVLKGGEGER